MTKVFQVRYWPGLGGINNSVADEYIGDSELSDARNYMPDHMGGGILTKREGLTKVDTNAITANVRGIYQGRNGVYVTAGTVTYDETITSLDAGLASAYPDWTSFATYDIMVNGTNYRKTDDGAAFTALANCPAGATRIAAANNFLYVAGHNRGRIRWANIGTAETWPTTNELVITQDENDDIIAIKPYKNALMVLCKKSFYLITGYTSLEQQVSYFSKEVGCQSHRSVIISTNVGAFWWNTNGVVWLKPDMSIDVPMMRKIPATLNLINHAYDAEVHACHDPMQKKVMFYLFYGLTQTTINMRADYYYETDTWYLHSGTGAAMLSAAQLVIGGIPYIYVGGYNPTYLYQHTIGGTDSGAAISAYLETKRESNPSMLSMSQKSVLTTNAATRSTMTYSIYVDNGTTVDRSWNLLPHTGVHETVVGTNRQFYKIKHRIADATVYCNKVYGLTHSGIRVRNR
jgi:hypothetical protein